MSTTPKYRVPLTSEQILYILSLAKIDYTARANQSSLDIIAKLSNYEHKIQNASISPAYISQEAKETLEQSLGMVSPNTPAIPKEELWKAAYQKYTDLGCIWTELSVTEIDAAKEHMYINDLMSDTEVAAFEGRELL